MWKYLIDTSTPRYRITNISTLVIIISTYQQTYQGISISHTPCHIILSPNIHEISMSDNHHLHTLAVIYHFLKFCDATYSFVFSVLCIKLTITDCVDLCLAIFHDCVITIVAVCVSSCHWSKRNSTDVLLVTVVPVSVAPGSGHSAHTGTGGHYL